MSILVNHSPHNSLMLNISSKTSPKEIMEKIQKLREQKGKEKETLELIRRASLYGNDFVVNLFWEKALTYHHLMMDEEAKGEKANNEKRIQYLLKMEEAVKHAGYFIVRFDQDRWKHRLYRFLGRVAEFKKEYKRAVSYYVKSLKFAKSDPDYLEKGYPRWFEVEGLLSSSLILAGQTTKGHLMAENVYRKFDTDKEAINLKKSDLTTWLIWRSGIPIRTINALIDKSVIFDIKEAQKWLEDAEKLLVSAKDMPLWADLKYRLTELKTVRERLENKEN